MINWFDSKRLILVGTVALIQEPRKCGGEGKYVQYRGYLAGAVAGYESWLKI